MNSVFLASTGTTLKGRGISKNREGISSSIHAKLNANRPWKTEYWTVQNKLETLTGSCQSTVNESKPYLCK